MACSILTIQLSEEIEAMEIFGANLRGIEGELVRFRVLTERSAAGVAVLGDAHSATRRGTIERCLLAIKSMAGFEQFNDALRFVIDLSPVEARVESPGIDLPLAITILYGYVMQSLEDLRKSIAANEEKLEAAQSGKRNKKDTPEAMAQYREQQLRLIAKIRAELETAEAYRKMIDGNATEYLFIGKLDITNGSVESPRDGMLGLVSAAGNLRRPLTVIVPDDAEIHASIVAQGLPGVTAVKVKDLTEVWQIVTGQKNGRACRTSPRAIRPKRLEAVTRAPDLKDIEGNGRAKLALEICLAGRHSLLMLGPAGQGKSMLAKAATKLLPELAKEELLEVNKIYSARGELETNELILHRPYQEVSNNVTEAALFGGGNAGASVRPGLISAAHRGVLFFDEVNLTSEAILDKLRAPWQNGEHQIQRANYTMKFPSSFQFIGAMNPCSCSQRFLCRCSSCNSILFGEQLCKSHPKASRRGECTCSPSEIRRHLGRLSGPILDRIDMVCLVSRYDQSSVGRDDWSSQTVKSRIKAAWQTQRERYAAMPGLTHSNGDIGGAGPLRNAGAINDQTVAQLEDLLQNKFRVEVKSIRKRDQLLGIARTIADLDQDRTVRKEHLVKAVAVSGLQERLLG